MKIIDAHLHSVSDKECSEFAQQNNIDCSEAGLKKACLQNNVEYALSIAVNFDIPTPMDIGEIKKQQVKNKRLLIAAGVNSSKKITQSQIKQTEAELKTGKVKAIKIYLGYTHYYASDRIYHPFYKLAEKYDCPVIFHTGDTFGGRSLLKYSHPLTIDEVAVRFPSTKFIMAHLGTPWAVDSAEVIYKNSNVFTDLSGLVIGQMREDELKLIQDKVRYAVAYVGDGKKFLYGTDWPLVSMKDYLRFMKKIVPKEIHEDFFYNNAKRLFKIP